MSQLPKGWSDVVLDDVVSEIAGGGTPSKSNHSYFDGEIPFMTVKDMNVRFPSDTKDKISKDALESSSARMIPAGTNIIATRMGLGKAVRPSIDVAINQDLKAIFPTQALDPEFLHWKLIQSAPHFLDLGTGTTVKGIRLEDVRALPIALPPLPEQRRIVVKLNELSARTKRTRKELARITVLTARYKQRLLTLAFAGKLTEGWRAANLDGLPTAKETAAGIESDKLQFSAEAIQAFEKKKLAGLKATKPRQLSTPEALTAEQKSSLWPLPERWQWLQIGTFCFVTKLAGFEYTDYVKYDPGGDLKVLKAENAGPKGFKPTAYSMIHSEAVAHLERSFLTGGELLIVFVGAGVGQVAIVPENERFFLGPNIGMARPYSKAISPRYMELFLRSEEGKKLLLISSKAVAQPSLSMGAIRATPVAIPSPEEQVEIIRRIDSAFGWLDRMVADQTAAAHLLAKLDAAILAKAFRGEIVLQDPNEEPSSVLLQRIKAELAVDGKKPQVRRARRSTGPREQVMKEKPQLARERLLHDSEKWPVLGLPFEDVAKRSKMPHDELRDALFELMSGPSPALRQRFDADAKMIVIQRVAA